jgi:hypothetical protein
MKLHRDLREFLQLLNAAEVRYLVVGGYAVAAHGHVRYTKDLDVWLDATAQNAARTVKVLHDFGFGSLDITEDDLSRVGLTVQIGYDPARIDLLTSVSGLEFAPTYERRTETTIDDIPTAIPNREDLKRNKLATGRPRDLADIDDLGFELPKKQD